MSNDETGAKIARLDERCVGLERRIASLEQDRRWLVVVIGALILRSAFDFIKSGGGL